MGVAGSLGGGGPYAQGPLRQHPLHRSGAAAEPIINNWLNKQLKPCCLPCECRAPSGSTTYSAKDMLLSGLSEADRQAVLLGAHEKGGEHISRLLKFVVARTGGWVDWVGALVGEWGQEGSGWVSAPNTTA